MLLGTMPKAEREGEKYTEFSLLPTLQAPDSASYWPNPAGSQLTQGMGNSWELAEIWSTEEPRDESEGDKLRAITLSCGHFVNARTPQISLRHQMNIPVLNHVFLQGKKNRS